jgi:pyruvate/2-oxoacid:ferredoxin oxidoreductase alpha subunit
MGPGWNIWADQNDSLSQRDTGWIQLYCETNQEVLDTTIQAFKLAEAVDLPVMVILDAFFLSHTSEPVDIPDQALVDEFLPKRDARLKLDTADPRAFGALVRPEDYMEMRWDQQEAMEAARRMFDEIDADWAVLTGRRWGAIERYQADDAELILVTSGTITSTARDVVDQRRADGEKVGLVKVKAFRPFPTGPIRRALRSARRVAVLDRNVSPGHGGIFAEELRSALYDVPLDDRPWVHGYVLGLGGRDVTPATIEEIIERTWAVDAPPREDLWVGVKT